MSKYVIAFGNETVRKLVGFNAGAHTIQYVFSTLESANRAADAEAKTLAEMSDRDSANEQSLRSMMNVFPSENEYSLFGSNYVKIVGGMAVTA